MPVCGVTLELATEAPQAIQEREFIRELIAQGLTKDEIKDRLVAEFGPEVLCRARRRGLRPGGLAGAGRGDPVAGGGDFRRPAALAAGRDWFGGAARRARADDGRGSKRLDADLARYEL